MPAWENWERWWRSAVEACSDLGPICKANCTPVTVEPPATLDEVRELEGQLGFALPTAFREVLLGFSRHIEFGWLCDPDDCQIEGPPEALKPVTAGYCKWGLSRLRKVDHWRQGWANEVFPDQSDPFEAVWYHKLAFQMDGYGNFLAIELGPINTGAVVYLCHDPDEVNGYVLGQDFIDFMNRWSQLGCPGPHDWAWRPFTTSRTSLLDPHCENARIWRRWLGLNL